MTDESVSKVLLDLYMQSQDHQVDEFCSLAFGALKRLIPFDSAIVAEGHQLPDGKLVPASVHLHNQPIEKWYDYERVRHLDQAAHKAAKYSGQPVVFESSVLPRTGEFGELRDYVKRYEVNHALIRFAPIAARGSKRAHKLRAVSLWRARENCGYTPQEQRLSNTLFEHFMRARELNQSWVLSTQSSSEETTTLVCDLRGRVQVSDFLCSRLLSAEWPQWQSPDLPRELMDSLRSTPPMHYAGRYLRVKGRHLGRHLVLHMLSTPPIPGLTQSESVVARLVSKPMSYKDAATNLGVSPATVRNHLHAVYEKLGLHSKSELCSLVMLHDSQHRLL